MSAVTRWTVGLLICGAAVTVSYLWIDRPVSYFVHDKLQAHRAIFDLAVRFLKMIGALAVACTLFLGFVAVARGALTKTQTGIVLSALSLTISEILGDWFKFAFGRTWPETWVQDNPSLIRDGLHNFHPFHGGPGFASFPSGHMVAICAIVSIFWFLHPRFQPIYTICIGTAFIALVGANYHFVSDLVAGGFIGFSVGWLTIALWNAGAHPIKVASVGPPLSPNER